MSRSQLPGRCKDCPIPEQPIVKGSGTADGPMILGEAPGAQEVVRGVPFVGQAGKVLRATLEACGISPDDVYITNSVICRPAGNATPTINHIECCSERLDKEVTLVQPTKILAVGSVALTSVLRASKSQPITKWRGRGFWTDWGKHPATSDSQQGKRIYTIATYHPAAILRDPELFRDFANDILKWSKNDHPQVEPILDELYCSDLKGALKAIKLIQEVSMSGIGCPKIRTRSRTACPSSFLLVCWSLRSSGKASVT